MNLGLGVDPANSNEVQDIDVPRVVCPNREYFRKPRLASGDSVDYGSARGARSGHSADDLSHGRDLANKKRPVGDVEVAVGRRCET